VESVATRPEEQKEHNADTVRTTQILIIKRENIKETT
jgi:hypothetical protein